MLRYRLGILLAISIAVLFALWQPSKQVTQPMAVTSPDTLPFDFIIEGFLITEYGQDGLPRHQLQGDRLEQYRNPIHSGTSTADRDRVTARIDNPRLTSAPEGGAPWQTNAERGWRLVGDERYLLQGGVLLQRPSETLVLRTESLYLLPSDDYAETAVEIEVEHGGDRLNAHGMRVFLDQGRIELLSQVRGRHALP